MHFVMDKCKQSPSVAFVCHFMAYNPCDAVCVVGKELVVWENVLYVFCGFGGGEFSFL